MSSELLRGTRETKIITAVDDAQLREFYSYVLSEEGYEVVSTGGNGDFLGQLGEVSLSKTKLLAILDIYKDRDRLSGKQDGLGLIKEIHLLERLHKVYIPIIVTTSFGKPENVDPMRELVDGVLSRPFGVSELLHMIDRIDRMNFPPGFIRS